MEWRRSIVRRARKMETGDPKAAPLRRWTMESFWPALFARDAIFGVRHSNLFGRPFECWIFGRLHPFERKFALINLFDCSEPEAFELALIAPVGGGPPRADSKCLPRLRTQR